MALTEEEKQKIIEEELFRKEQQEKLKTTSSQTNGIASLVIGVVSFFLGIFGIIIAPLGLYLGFKSKKIEKSPFAWAGIIVNSLFIVYIAVAILLGIATFNLVKDVQNEDTYTAVKHDNKYSKYLSVDSLGDKILDLTQADTDTQISVWNESELKKEFLALFPDFDAMRNFVKNRIKGDPLTAKLLTHINTIENKFFSGSIGAAEAHEALSVLK